MGTATCRARREKCQETSCCCGGQKVGGTTASVVGEWRAAHKTGDARGRWSWRSSLLGDPGSKFICGKLENTGRKKKEHTRKKRDGIRTAELNRRDQVTAA